MAMRKTIFCLFLLTPALISQPRDRPARTFGTQCTICHGGDANGTDRAPGILPFVTSHSDAEFSALVHSGRLDRGMPRFDFNDAEMKTLIGHLRGLTPAQPAPRRDRRAAAAAADPSSRTPRR